MKIAIKINDEEFLLLRNKTKNTADCDLCDFKEHCNMLMPQMRMLPCITFAESFFDTHNNVYFTKVKASSEK